jgi:4-deoxy-L-threo-5-hexosulose-uronate ketol-isomerase
MKIMQMADRIRFQQMSTDELRETFLVENLFQPGRIHMAYVDLDRAVIGSAVPIGTSLELETDDALKASYFLERRELGILNIGAPGAVNVDGEQYDLDSLDALYIGRGSKSVSFTSNNSQIPAEFYLLSYPAHTRHPVAQIRSALEASTKIGSAETANDRRITRLIHLGGTSSCQLVMGFTQLALGSVWNTMPPHTHMRRSEIYLYFDMSEKDRVIHLMGPAEETRHLVVANKQAIISPGWSIHAGAGTSNYKFCWGMGGENQAYEDMDPLTVAQLR